MLRSLQRIAIALLLAVSSGAASTTEAPALPQLLPLHAALQDKNFYLLSLFEADSQVMALLAHDEQIEAIQRERQNALTRAEATCKQDTVCALKPLLWNDEETRAISHALSRLYSAKPSVRALVNQRLRPSGTYVLYADRSDAELLAHAWEVCASGLNEIVSVYGQGEAPRYPLIDSPSLDPKSDGFHDQVAPALQSVASGGDAAFFQPSLTVALHLLTINRRDEAARLEPMETGVNKVGLQAIAKMQWRKYAYSVIIVPGAGGGTEADPLSPAGRRRVALAAEVYYAGKAPLILVSGGYVHPAQTRFAEADEMKKALIKDFSVPESAILVDPHARHTTTNMRNAAREIFRYGIPMQKPALMVSDPAQTAYIAGEIFADRCLREMGYMPYRILQHVSDTSLAFAPLVDSLEQDPLDPLDP